MSNISTISREQAMPGESLESRLLYLSKYGLPRVSMMRDGTWLCTVEVFVTGDGVQFEVKSSMDDRTPIEAVDACVARLNAALDQIQRGEK